MLNNLVAKGFLMEKLIHKELVKESRGTTRGVAMHMNYK